MDPSLISGAPKRGFDDGTTAIFLHTLIVKQDVYKVFDNSTTDDMRKKTISAFIASQICKQMFWDCDELDLSNLNNTHARLSQLPAELRLQIYDTFLYENPIIRHHHVPHVGIFTPRPNRRGTTFERGMRFRQGHLTFLSSYPVLYSEMLAEYLCKSLSLRDGIVNTTNVCYAYSFDCDFDEFGQVVHELFFNPWGTWANKDAGHLWLSVTDNVGIQWSNDYYEASLKRLTEVLRCARRLKRVELEWNIGKNIEPVIQCSPEERLCSYGYAVGWKDGTDEWHMQFYTRPGVYCWGAHKMEGTEGVEAQWTWSGGQLDLTGLPIFVWMIDGRQIGVLLLISGAGIDATWTKY